MKRYLIKATYLSGRHAGQSYLLRKGGYVTESGRHEYEDTTYKSLGIAKRVCRAMEEKNELDYKIERRSNEERIKRGKAGKEWFIYERMSYEPLEVEV